MKRRVRFPKTCIAILVAATLLVALTIVELFIRPHDLAYVTVSGIPKSVESLAFFADSERGEAPIPAYLSKLFFEASSLPKGQYVPTGPQPTFPLQWKSSEQYTLVGYRIAHNINEEATHTWSIVPVQRWRVSSDGVKIRREYLFYRHLYIDLDSAIPVE